MTTWTGSEIGAIFGRRRDDGFAKGAVGGRPNKPGARRPGCAPRSIPTRGRIAEQNKRLEELASLDAAEAAPRAGDANNTAKQQLQVLKYL
jgi:hypothetical protein